MLAPANLVHETSTTTGTGNFTLAAVNGKQRFSDASAFGTGVTTNVFDYYISHRSASEWERGTGHMSAVGTLVRDTVIQSSNSNNAVNFSAGTKDVLNDIPATDQANTARPYATRAAIKALDTTVFTIAYLTESGRDGTFVWRSGNYSSQIAADTQEGIFLKADAIAATEGAWVYVFAGDIEAAWFGASASAASSTAAIQCAIDVCANIYGGGKVVLPLGDIGLDASTLGEYYESAGVPALTDTAVCLVLRPGVSLVGRGMRGQTRLVVNNPPLSALWAISPSGQVVSDMEIDGQWDTVSGGTGFPLVNYRPTDVDRTNLLSPGTFTGTTESWSISGNGTLSSTDNALRITHNASVTTVPFAYKSFATTIGVNYRLRFTYDEGTIPAGSIEVAFATGTTVGSRVATHHASWSLTGGTFTPSYARVVNFVATGTTTYVHFYSNEPTPSNLNNDWFAIDAVVVTDFPVDEQMDWCRDFVIERVYAHHFVSYGPSIEDGDISNLVLRDCLVEDVGGDGIDIKQRGTLQRNDAVKIIGNVVRRFGLRFGGSAGIDTHGIATIRDNVVDEFGLAAKELIGIRARTYGPLFSGVSGVEGEQARGTVIDGNTVRPEQVGTTYGIAVGSKNVQVTNNYVNGGVRGIVFSGNAYGGPDDCTAAFNTCDGQSEYGFDTGADNTRFISCQSENCSIAGFYNHGTNTKFIGCWDTGSVAAKSASATPLQTETVVGSFGDWLNAPLGGAIDWNNGDVTLTHSSNALTIYGADYLALSQSGGAPTYYTARTDTHGSGTTVGAVTLQGRNASAAAKTYAQISAYAASDTAGAESGYLLGAIITGGALTTVWRTSAAAFAPNSNDAAALGTTSLNWSDIHLANGGVVNFNNGNVTITHASGSLTVAGATLVTEASSTTRAGLRIPSGTAPSSPTAGDLWFDGTNLKFRAGGTTRTLTWT